MDRKERLERCARAMERWHQDEFWGQVINAWFLCGLIRMSVIDDMAARNMLNGSSLIVWG